MVDGLVCGVLRVVQWWLERGGEGRLVVVTRGGVAWEPNGVSDLAAAAVWGLVRSAQSENPDRIVLVDVPDWDASARTVADAAGLGEPQVALRGGQIWAPRLQKLSESDLLPIPAAAPLLSPASGEASPDSYVGGELKGESDGWALGVVDGGGSLDGVGLVAGEGSGELAAGEVRVAVAAVGLNFRDVLMALGMYPGSEVRIGGEGSGVVVETGPGVHNVSVGDRVMGLFRGGIGPVSVTDHRLLVRVPAGLGLVEAAGVPVVFATAFYGLRDLGGLSAGETVLVHAASGGVGMRCGAARRGPGARGCLGTASRGKVGFLRGQGFAAEEIADSRSTSFEG
ncbi:SpnB-like Rossmann fold domain-containing protein [Actinomadura rupiterrae]|uniref:SpnB-like Rossmann fold domain-containing protein n=1 Tax=Actinomadura rupiterrae TaxID=559627 RepID=UPI0020A33DB9|nr:alcohol dehydrogenase catalytic domain-containing protein [Actinomadura rupiterrae]MCP2341495.1 hypothetical protein [Actinomadura rupiterrae]